MTSVARQCCFPNLLCSGHAIVSHPEADAVTVMYANAIVNCVVDADTHAVAGISTHANTNIVTCTNSDNDLVIRALILVRMLAIDPDVDADP